MLRTGAEATTYVGRERELDEAKRLLGSSSLVTLTGPGGVGKTRLALRVAAAARAAFRDDVVFVPLGDLTEPELLVSTVAVHLGLGDRSTRPAVDLIVDALRSRRMLIVLDNCEHLVDACAALVGTLVSSCPDIVVLTTSRQSLGIASERQLPVPPLATPAAIRLFVDRATAVVPSFVVTDENRDDVEQLCGQLDGLPLAIELAAVRLRSLSVQQLTERLHRQFALLTGGARGAPTRHETLRSLIDWSHDLCTEPERLLWARASTFSGSFDLDAAEAVCSGGGLDPPAVLDVVDGLLDKSVLLREEDNGVVRYRMLETVRQYGADRLRAAGDERQLKRRHRDWCASLVERVARQWLGPDQVAVIDLLRRDHANLRAALDFCVSDSAEAVVGLHMAPRFKEYWMIRGHNTEARLWLGKLLEVARDGAPGRAHALWMYAFFSLVQGDMPAYEARLAEAAEVADRTKDELARAYVFHVRGYEALIGDDMPTATHYFGTAMKMFRDQQDLGGELWSQYNYGHAVALGSDLQRGLEILRSCVDTCTERGEVFWRSWALWSQASAEYLQGDVDRATQLSQDLLRLQLRVDDRGLIAFALTVLAGCMAKSGQPKRSARLFGCATTVWQSMGASPARYEAFAGPMAEHIEHVTQDLGLEPTVAEFTAGAAMSTEAALAYAIGDEQPDVDEPEQRVSDVLTNREAEIAALVADGLTNREIAQKLVIARRTAETHVERILTKLGFTNRTQIAAWFARARR